jgi:murein DD-endopeptidase MepM/ murein hydrolase activator NlpD
LAAAEPVPGSEVEARVRIAVAKFLERFHYSPNLVDADALAAEARRRSEETGSTGWLVDWLNRELYRAEWAFAPTSARPDPAVRYGLPFDPVFPRYLNDTDTHTGRSSYAFDFVMPVGTPVRAAREGVVARVVDGFTKGGDDPALGKFANVVHVLHSDGTFASYLHLSPGIPVKEGERVSRGQAIASSGQTGFSAAPHLHFSVDRNGPDGPQSIPIRFGRPGGEGFLPELGTWVGSPPRPTIELTLYAEGVLVRPGAFVSARSGEHAHIRVEVRPPGGPARDVTQHPRLQLVSMTPWNLEVVGPGEVVLRPMEEFPLKWGLDLDLAAVGVFFLNGEQREVGLGKVEFRLTDRSRKAAP